MYLLYVYNVLTQFYVGSVRNFISAQTPTTALMIGQAKPAVTQLVDRIETANSGAYPAHCHIHKS